MARGNQHIPYATASFTLVSQPLRLQIWHMVRYFVRTQTHVFLTPSRLDYSRVSGCLPILMPRLWAGQEDGSLDTSL